MKQNYTFSASDFSYLWKVNPYAFYEKHAYGIKRPFLGSPNATLNGLIQGSLIDTNLKALGENFPDAVAKEGPFLRGQNRTCGEHTYCVTAKPDLLLEYSDGTRGVAIIQPYASTTEKALAKQLQALAYAAVTDPECAIQKLDQVGVFIVAPIMLDTTNSPCIKCEPQWKNYTVDTQAFETFLQNEVFPFLDEICPEASENDPFWKYLSSYDFS